jgi:hypothetical protein
MTAAIVKVLIALLSGILMSRKSTAPRDDGRPEFGFVMQDSLFCEALSG